MSGDVGGFFGGEKRDRGGDVGGLAEAAEGDEFDDFIFDLLGEDVGHVGGDEAGGDAVGGDLFAGEFAGDGFGHADDAGFGGGVVDLAGVADDSGDAGDVDDASPLGADHGAGGGAAGDEGGFEVGVDDVVEVGIIHAHEESVAGDAGVVDEDVESSVLFNGLFDMGGEGGTVGDIDGTGFDGEAFFSGGFHHGVQLVLIARDGDHMATIRRQCRHDGFTDSPRPARDIRHTFFIRHSHHRLSGSMVKSLSRFKERSAAHDT